MSAPAVAATGTAGPDLAEGYRRCAEVTRRHGTTYFWGALLLPREQRRHVHAVYTLCRMADDVVDAPGATGHGAVERTRAELMALDARFRAALDGAEETDPVLAAVATSVNRAGIDPECFERFFGAMAQDLTTTRYATWDDLCGYMEGSAAVIGEMMLPVLQPDAATRARARDAARSLGLAFQLTNFLRDVGEDLDRGRVYVPQEDLERFGADPWRRTADDAWRALMRFEIERNRELYRAADRGVPLLPPASARCVATARSLYAEILERIEARGHDVFGDRARVPLPRKVGRAATALTRPATALLPEPADPAHREDPAVTLDHHAPAVPQAPAPPSRTT